MQGTFFARVNISSSPGEPRLRKPSELTTDVHFPVGWRNFHFDSDKTSAENGQSWRGGVMTDDGLIYTIPHDSAEILVLNTTSGKLDSVQIPGGSGNRKWAGGILVTNNLIYGIPFSSSSVLIFDTMNNAVDLTSLSGLSEDPNKWFDAVIADNGNIYCIPYDADSVLIIDTTANTLDVTSIASINAAMSSGMHQGKWSGGVKGPTGLIYAIPFNADSVLIINPTVNSWDVTTFRDLTTFPGKWAGGVISHTGHIVGIPHSFNSVLLLDPSTNTTDITSITTPDGKEKWAGGVWFQDKIYTAPFSSSSVLIIDPEALSAEIRPDPGAFIRPRFASLSQFSDIELVDIENGDSLQSISIAESVLNSISFNNNGTLIVAGGQDELVRVWNSISGELIATYTGHQSSTLQASVHTDGKLIASADAFGLIHVWNAETGEIITTYRDHPSSVLSVIFSADGQKVASCGGHRQARVWNHVTGETLLVLTGHEDNVNSICFSSNGLRLATGSSDQTVRVWDAKTGSLQKILPFGANKVQFHPKNDNLLAAVSVQDMRVWNIHLGTAISNINPISFIACIDISPGGDYIATGSWDHLVRVYKFPSLVLTSVFSGHSDRVSSISFSPDGSSIVSGSVDGTIKVSHLVSQTEILSYDNHQVSVITLSFINLGKYIMSVSRDGIVQRLGGRSEEPVVSFSPGNYVDVSFGDDPSQIVIGGHDGSVKLWSTATGELLDIITAENSDGSMHSMSLSYNSLFLATSGGFTFSIRLWKFPQGDFHTDYFGHEGFVNSIVFSRNGKLIVSGSVDNTVRVWDMSTKMLKLASPSTISRISFAADINTGVASVGDDSAIVFNAHTGEISLTIHGNIQDFSKIAMSIDGSRIVSSNEEGALRVWDAKTSEIITTLHKHSERVSAMAFHPNGPEFVSIDVSGTRIIWNTVSWEEISVQADSSHGVESAAYSPDGLHFVTGGAREIVQVWDAQSWESVFTLSGRECEFCIHSIVSIAFSPDSKKFVTGTTDSTVNGLYNPPALKIWDISDGTAIHSFSGHVATITTVAFSLDGSQIISGSGDNTIRFWDIASQQQAKVMRGHKKPIISVVPFSGNAEKLISVDMTGVMLVSVIGEPHLMHSFSGHQNSVTSVDVSQDSRTIISGSLDRTVRVWDIHQKRIQRTIPCTCTGITSVVYGFNDAWIAAGTLDGRVIVWDAVTGDSIIILNQHLAAVRSIAVSPSGKIIISGADDSRVIVWDTSNWNVIRIIATQFATIQTVRFSSDEQYVLVGTNDRYVRVWTTPIVPQTYQCEPWNSILTAVFSPDGRQVASSGLGEVIRVWDIASTVTFTTFFPAKHDHIVRSLAFSPDGSLLASGSDDKTAKVWSVADEKLYLTLNGHTESVYAVAFSPDGMHIVTASGDASIKLWLIDGTEIASLNEHTGPVMSVRFNTDGKLFASGSQDMTIKVWNFETKQILTDFKDHNAPVASLWFSPDSTEIISSAADSQILIWNRESQRVTQRFPGNTRHLAFTYFGPASVRTKLWGAVKSSQSFMYGITSSYNSLIEWDLYSLSNMQHNSVINNKICHDDCLARPWCKAFIIEEIGISENHCSLLPAVEVGEHKPSENRSLSFERVEIKNTAVAGIYLFEGTADDCEQICKKTYCALVFSDKDVCAVIKESIVAAHPLSTIHPTLEPLFSRYLPGPEPGSRQRYCIRATNPIWYVKEGYSSEKTCQDFFVDWESSIEGTVSIDSNEIHLPVEGVDIQYEIGRVHGRRQTNSEGRFSIHIISSEIVHKTEEIKLSFTKKTGTIKHTFLCNGIPCTTQKLLLEHLRFDRFVHIRDTTSLPFSGIVSIGGTEHERLPDGCPLFGVQICLYDRLQENRLLSCTTTDETGRFITRAVIGASVTVELTMPNATHTFVRAPFEKNAANAPSGVLQTVSLDNVLVWTEYYDITEDHFWENINFKDVTTSNAVVDVAGGYCNFHLGSSSLEFRFDRCPTWVRSEYTESRLSSWILPAQIIAVRLVSVNHDSNVQSQINSYFSAILGEAQTLYLDLRNLDQRRGNNDLTEQTVRFEYHPPPNLKLNFDRSLEHGCRASNNQTLHVLTQLTIVQAVIKVTEDFGKDIGVCDVVPGEVEITNRLGESPEIVAHLNKTTNLQDTKLEKLKVCYEPCKISVFMDEQSNGEETVLSNSRVELTLMTGDPEINENVLTPLDPFTKLFTVAMHKAPHPPVKHSAHVVVVGDRIKSKFFSVPFPRFKPLMVVQDPPGGLSSVTYSKSQTTYSIRSTSAETFHGLVNRKETAPVKIEQESLACAGGLFMKCTLTHAVESKPFVFSVEHKHSWGVKNQDKNFATETSWHFSIDMSTSDDPDMAGERSDMFLVPALNVIWLETDEIFFNEQTCKADKKVKVKWSLDADTNKQAMAWLSQFEIEQKELPDLRRLLKLSRRGPDPEETVEDNEARIEELSRAIEAWEENIAENRKIREQAANGTLPLLQRLRLNERTKYNCDSEPKPIDDPEKVPTALSSIIATRTCEVFSAKHLKNKANSGISLAPFDDIDAASDLNGEPASEIEKTEMMSLNTFKFSGGGSTYTFSYDVGEVFSSMGSTSRTHSVDVSLGSEFSGKVLGKGASIDVSADYVFDRSVEDETDASVGKFGTVSFTLGDPDPLDVFDVQIFLHPKFGSFVFHTVAGQSSCPHEPNTVKLEAPRIELKKWPLSPVLPWEPAVFELLLINEGRYASDYILYPELGDNQDGLKISVNGAPLVNEIHFNGFEPGARYITVTIQRGPSKFKYDGISIILESECMPGWNHPTVSTSKDTVDLLVEFLQPCSSVRLVGDVGETGHFLVNSDLMKRSAHSGEIRVVAFNPDFSRQTWKDNSRLQGIFVEYKQLASHLWIPARNKSGNALDFSKLENQFGYASAWWDASDLQPGFYDLRIRAQCQSSIFEMPEGIDYHLSNSATGVVDRDPPVLFGFPEPSDGYLYPGDKISFLFSENIDCRQPYVFQATMTVNGYDREFNNNNMIILCEGRKLALALRRGFKYDDVNGKNARVVINNVKDQSENRMSISPEHSFKFAELHLQDASATLNGLVLLFPFEDAYSDPLSPSFQNIVSRLIDDFIHVLDVTHDRIKVISLMPYDPKNYSLGVEVSLKLRPPGSKQTNSLTRHAPKTLSVTATELAAQFVELVQSNSFNKAELSILSKASGESNVNIDIVPTEEDHRQQAARQQGLISQPSSATDQSNNKVLCKYFD